MGWWKSGEHDILGDMPADGITGVLQGLAETAVGSNRPKPTLTELMTALATILDGHGEEYLEIEPSGLSGTITLRGRALVTLPTRGTSASPDYVDRLRPAIAGVTRAYDEAVGRHPRISELLATFSFVLSGDPTVYLSGANPQPLKAGDLIFTPVTAPSPPGAG